MTWKADPGMPTFQYQTLTADGTRQSGMITAQNRADAVRQLLDVGKPQPASPVQPLMTPGPDHSRMLPQIEDEQGSVVVDLACHVRKWEH